MQSGVDRDMRDDFPFPEPLPNGNNMDSDQRFERVRTQLTARLGSEVYSSWFGRMKLAEASKGIVRLSETRSDEGRTRTTQTLASSNLEQLNSVLVQATAERTEAEARLRAATKPGSTQLALQNQ